MMKYMTVSIALMSVVMSLYRVSFNSSEAESAISRIASSGDEVIMIQSKLKEYGLYDGDISGIYDVSTAEAVRRYQQYKGIEASGVAGPQTLALLEVPLDGCTSEASDIELLAKLITQLAGNADYLTKLNVGAMVMNRVRSEFYPNTVAGVIYQNGAFPDIYITVSDDSSFRAARDVYYGFELLNIEP